jgi:hypothetical protein
MGGPAWLAAIFAAASLAVAVYCAGRLVVARGWHRLTELDTAAFAARLTEELDADAVTEDLARSVHTALEPAHLSIWLSEHR